MKIALCLEAQVTQTPKEPVPYIEIEFPPP
jgi:hypothetical protein